MQTKPLTLIFGFLLGISSLHAVVIEYRHGTDNAFVTNYAGVDQAFLLVNTNPASFGNYNTGGFGTFIVGRSNARQGIVAFDLTSMQGQFSSIESAQLTFYRTGLDTNLDFTISMYQIFGTNVGWNQGTGAGGAVGPNNTVTYLNQNYSSVGSENVPWEDSSGDPVANFSSAYNASLLDSVTYTTTTDSITFDIPVALVQSWINNPGTNAGLAFIPSGAGATNATVANLGNSFAAEAFRPLLAITYTAIPEPGVVGSLLLGGLVLFLHGRRRLTPLFAAAK